MQMSWLPVGAFNGFILEYLTHLNAIVPCDIENGPCRYLP